MALVKENQMQVILFVKDMAPEVQFYKDLLGLPIRYPEGVTDFSTEMWVEFDCGGFSLALHGGAQRLPDDLHEVVFWVEDIVHARDKLVEAGVEIGEIRDLEDGAPIGEGRDPAGHRFAIRS